MSQKKGGGSSKNGRDSRAKKLGIKVYGNQIVKKGSIIVRQRGLTIKPGLNTGIGKDYTIFSLKEGLTNYKLVGRTNYINVYSR